MHEAAPADITRVCPPADQGLNSAQVAARQKAGFSNKEQGAKTKSCKQIILENTFTPFNILNFLLALAVLLVGSYRNLLFMGVIFFNILIGTVQSIRAKRTIDKLSLISSAKATVIRDGRRQDIPIEELVLDDVMLLSAGRQICADAVVLDGCFEVNEALLTGESDPVVKQAGDTLLSGSFVVSGNGAARTDHVGADNYAARLTRDAGYVKSPNSEIMRSLDLIIKTIGFVLLPVGILLFCRQFFFLHTDLQQSVVRTVAALIGMIPEGLVLLTSVVFAVSVLRLSRHQTLAQDLYCVETLARVDVLCLDKTGTITEGEMELETLLPLDGHTRDEMNEALSSLTAVLQDDNATFRALQRAFPPKNTAFAHQVIPFSSARKWSGASFADCTLVFGAGEFLLGEAFAPYAAAAASYLEDGQRMLLLATAADGFSENGELPPQLRPLGLLFFRDTIRPEAADTLRYFHQEGVDLKVISGDSALTAAQIAKRAGLVHWENYTDTNTLSEEELKEAALHYHVFGRVTPQQKLLLVKALKEAGHTVAMTGDGVNDVLALKEADCGIAMAAGSEAARTVSDLVLLDSDFSSLPHVVAEGRRSINNLQRSAALFLTKTVFSTLLSFFFLLMPLPYPFLPIQLTLISALTIGVPSFILALEPNHERVHGRFLSNVFFKSLPASAGMLGSVLFLSILSALLGYPKPLFSTLAVYATAAMGFFLVLKLCYPFNPLRTALFCTVALGFLGLSLFAGSFFSLLPLGVFSLILLFGLFCLGLSCSYGMRLFLGYLQRNPHRFGRLRRFFIQMFHKSR